MKKYLSPDEIQQIHETSVALDLAKKRNSLLSGIPIDFVNSISTDPAPASQLLLDLNTLNSIEKLADGSIPLQLWLKNAVVLSSSRKQKAIFTKALRKLPNSEYSSTIFAISESTNSEQINTFLSQLQLQLSDTNLSIIRKDDRRVEIESSFESSEKMLQLFQDGILDKEKMGLSVNNVFTNDLKENDYETPEDLTKENISVFTTKEKIVKISIPMSILIAVAVGLIALGASIGVVLTIFVLGAIYIIFIYD